VLSPFKKEPAPGLNRGRSGGIFQFILLSALTPDINPEAGSENPLIVLSPQRGRERE